MNHFLRSPRWLAGHVLALVTVVLFVNLGLWQLRRADEVRTRNDLIEQRMAEPVAPLETLLASAEPSDALFRRVEAQGTYDTSGEVLLTARSHNGRPGHHVLTPLLLADGTAVIIDRGWVPMEYDAAPVSAASPVAGDTPVEIAGLVLPPDPPSSFGPRTPEGRDDLLGRVDLRRLAQRVDVPLADFYVLAQEQQPPPPDVLPVPAALPPLDDGPHLSYAVQWFLFALVVVVGYPMLLRRALRDRQTQPREVREPVNASF